MKYCWINKHEIAIGWSRKKSMKKTVTLLYSIASLTLAIGFATITYDTLFKGIATSFHPIISVALSVCMLTNCIMGFKRLKELIDKQRLQYQ